MFREREHERSRAEHMWQGSRVILRIWLQLRKGYVAGCIDEAEKIAIGDRGAVDPEPVDLHPVRRRLFRIVVVGSIWNVSPGTQIIPSVRACGITARSEGFAESEHPRTEFERNGTT